MAGCGRIRIAEQQLEQCDEVVRVPLAGGIRLADAELAAQRDAREKRSVVNRQAHGGSLTEPPALTTRQLDLERTAVEPGEGATQQSEGDALQRTTLNGCRRGANAHPRTLPRPGTNRGLG